MLGVMIAGGEYPDMTYPGDKAHMLIDAGALLPLEDLIEEHAPNLKKLYANYWERMKATDVRMPLLSGLDLMMEVSGRIACQFIIISGYSELDYVLSALKYGAVDYLLKPLNVEQLIVAYRIDSKKKAGSVLGMRSSYKEAHI